MIIYILLGVLIFISFSNLLFLIGINNFLIKFYDFITKEDSPKSIKKNINNEKGLIDINAVGTYDARFNQQK